MWVLSTHQCAESHILGGEGKCPLTQTDLALEAQSPLTFKVLSFTLYWWVGAFFTLYFMSMVKLRISPNGAGPKKKL